MRLDQDGTFAPDRRSVARLAWSTLLFNLLIILWGALVRATGSGAGCGAHWPLCDGQIVPTVQTAHRAIEFTHRLSVGVGLVLVVWLFVRVRRAFTIGHPARTQAVYALVFTLSESLIGAALVLFKWVAHNDTAYRAVAVSAHLINTFLLVAALTLTAWYAEDRPRLRIRHQGTVGWMLGAALAGALIVAVMGAVTALGDTLFPPASRQEIGRQVATNAHFLVQLRVYHPMAAVLLGIFAASIAWIVARLRPGAQVRAIAYWVPLIVALQVGAGFLNLMLLAPLALQLLHLLLADALWIALVLLAASALAEGAPRAMRIGAEQLTAEPTL